MKIKLSTWAKNNGVNYRTTWNYVKSGKLKVEQLPPGSLVVIVDTRKEEKTVVYARVSPFENKENLDRQAERVEQFCAAKGWQISGVYKEVGSGLNDNRKQLEKILVDKTITRIVVEHKDRLARFGLNYLQKLLEADGGEIVVINLQDNNKDDLMQDFVSIITLFTARLYGLRRSKRKTEQLIKELERK